MFYDNLIQVCNLKGVKITTLIKSLSMSKGSISSWRTGSIPKGDTLNKIAGFLNVTTDYLLNGVQSTNTAIVSPLEQAILDRRPNLPKAERERLLSILNATIDSYLKGI